MANDTIEVFLKAKDQASREIKKARESVSSFTATAKKASDGLEKGLNTAFKALGAAAVVGVGIAIYQMQKLAKEGVALANVQEKAEAKVRAVIRATGGAAGFTAEEMGEMASAMQRVIGVGDELILNGMALLATFKNVRGEAFERTTAAALDMAHLMGGDLQASLLMMSKAMNDPVKNLSAMSRAGVTFTDTQTEMIKELWAVGEQAKAQSIILSELESQMGGLAAEYRLTFAGSVDAAKGALSDLKEQLGFFITKNEDWVEVANNTEQMLFRWGDAIKKLREEGNLDVWATAMAMGVVSAFENMAKAAQFFLTIIPKIRIQFGSLAQVGFGIWAKKLKSDLKSAQAGLETFEEELKQFQAGEGIRYKTPFSEGERKAHLYILEQVKKYKEEIKETTKELEANKINIEAAGLMMEGNAEIVDGIEKTFSTIIKDISRIKTGMEAVKDPSTQVKEDAEDTAVGIERAVVAAKALAENLKKVTVPMQGPFDPWADWAPAYPSGGNANSQKSIFDILAGAGDIFKGKVSDSGDIMIAAGGQLSEVLDAVGEKYHSELADFIGEMVGMLYIIQDVANMLSELVNLIPNTMNAIADVFSNISQFDENMKDSFDNLVTSISDAGTSIGHFFETTWNDIASTWDRIWSGSAQRSYIGGGIEISFDGDVLAGEAIGVWVKRLDQDAKDAANDIISLVAQQSAEAFDRLVGQFSEGIQSGFYDRIIGFIIQMDTAETSRGGDALQAEFQKNLEALTSDVVAQLQTFLTQSIIEYGESLISQIQTGDVAGILAPTANIFYQLELAGNQLALTAEMSIDELVTLVEALEDLSDAAKDAIDTWEDIQWQMLLMTEDVSQLEQDTYNLNKQFDNMIETMTELGATEDILAQIEDNRITATERLIDVEEKAVESMLSSIQLIDRLLAELGPTGDFAPVQSLEAYQLEFARLYTATLSGSDIAGAVSQLTAFIPDYIDFMKAFGGDYAGFISDLTSQLENLKGTLGAMGIAPVPIPAYASGGLATKLGIVGERGPEWVIPTYEPERSRLLSDLGIDFNPKEIGKAIAFNLLGGMASHPDLFGGQNKEQNVHVMLGEQSVRDAVIRGLRGRDATLINEVRRTVR